MRVIIILSTTCVCEYKVFAFSFTFIFLVGEEGGSSVPLAHLEGEGKDYLGIRIDTLMLIRYTHLGSVCYSSPIDMRSESMIVRTTSKTSAPDARPNRLVGAPVPVRKPKSAKVLECKTEAEARRTAQALIAGGSRVRVDSTKVYIVHQAKAQWSEGEIQARQHARTRSKVHSQASAKLAALFGLL